jgi:hypothetical protein
MLIDFIDLPTPFPTFHQGEMICSCPIGGNRKGGKIINRSYFFTTKIPYVFYLAVKLTS